MGDNIILTKSVGSINREEILRLRQIVFKDEDPIKETPEYWNWEFIDGYFGEAEKYLVLTDAIKVIGYYAFLPQRYKVFNKEYSAGLPVDAMIDPEFRRLRIFSKLQQFSITTTSASFLIGYTKRKEILPAELKGGYLIAKKIPLYIYPTNWKLIIKRFLPSKSLTNFISFFPTLFFNTVYKNKRLNKEIFYSEIVSDLSVSLDNFFQNKTISHDIYSIKNNDFIKWRYDDIPLVNYEKFIIKESTTKVIGYFVLREKIINGINFLNIVDLELLYENKNLLKYIIREIKIIAKKRKIAGVTFLLLDNGFISSIVKNSGFLKFPLKLHLMMQNTCKEQIVEDFIKSKKVFLTSCDTDLL